MRQAVELYENGVLVGTEDGGEIPTEIVNRSTIEDQAAQALAANRTFITAAKPGTAAAQASAAYDQTRALSRQNNGLIRLLLGLLDGTD